MRLNVMQAGSGPPVALLHGLFGSASNLGVLARALAARHRVLSFDLRGHGDSPRGADMGYAALADDVAETLVAHAATPVALVGHSMGGKTAMMVALTRPDLVARIAVLDIAPVAHAPALRHYIAAMRAVPLRPGLTRRDADAALASAVPEAPIRGFLLQNLRFAAGAAPEWRLDLDAIEPGMPDIEGFPDSVARYDGPALFLRGERSNYVRPEHEPRIRALFPAARIATVPNAGHWLHSENPAGVLAALAPFLEGEP